jgi:hypothetical protein
MNRTRENNLHKIAQYDSDNKRANKALKILRQYFDPTYFYCSDCDDLLTIEKECCYNLMDMPVGDDEDIKF